MCETCTPGGYQEQTTRNKKDLKRRKLPELDAHADACVLLQPGVAALKPDIVVRQPGHRIPLL